METGKMAGVKLQDVAAKVGVSLATASLALSGKGRVSPDMRARVRAAAAALGYTARIVPRGRIAAAAGNVAILRLEDRDYEWSFIRPILSELEQNLLAKGYAPVSVPVGLKMPPERVRDMIRSTRSRAVFAVHYGNGRLFEELEAEGIRLVVVNNSSYQDRFYSVCVDDFQGAYEGALYLIGLGHRAIAFVEYERPDQPGVIADRFVGFRKALDENRLPFSAEQRISIRFMDEARLAKKLGTLFARAERPTAIFSHDDYLGMFVISALKDLGLGVPEDVSLIAPGDVLDYAIPRTPQITTMRINTALLGRTAASLMLDRLNNERKDVHVLKVKEQLVRRSTCRKVEQEGTGGRG